MGRADDSVQEQTYNPWTVVNVVFRHLAETGLHPTLGTGGDPGEHAARLLRALGVSPTAEGDSRVSENTREELASLRATLMDEA